MRQVVWTFAAQSDVDSIYRYFVALNPIAARRITAELYGSTDILKRFPELGHETTDDTREWNVGKYVLVYETGQAGTRIPRVWHGRRTGRDRGRQLSHNGTAKRSPGQLRHG